MSLFLSRLVLVICSLLALPPLAHGQPKQPPGRTDLHGVPLPEGAVARLGNRRFHLPGGVGFMAYAPDSKTVLVSTYERDGVALIFWDTATAREITRLAFPDRQLSQPTFSPDGKSVAVNRGGVIELFDWRTGKALRTFGKSLDIRAFAFSPDGSLLAAGCFEWKDHNPIRVWEVATGKELAPFPGRGVSLTSLQFSADGKQLLSGAEGGTFQKDKGTIPGFICVWDVASRKKLHELPRPNSHVAFTADGKSAAVQDKNGTIQVFDLATGAERCQFATLHATFAFTPDGKGLVTCDGSEARLWDTITGKELRRFRNDLKNDPYLGRISPDGKVLALLPGRWADSIRFWDMATGEEIRHGSGHRKEVTSVAFAPNGKRVASGSLDRTVRLWDAATGKELRCLAGHTDAVTAVAFAPAGKVLASASADGTVRLWDAATGKELAQFEGPPAGAAALTFAPDGKTLFAGAKSERGGRFVNAAAAGATVHAWDLASGKRIRHFKADEDGSVFAITPDGTVALSANGSERELAAAETLRLWNTATGKQIREIALRATPESYEHIPCHTGTFSADGRWIATSQVLVTHGLRISYGNPSLRIWDRVTGQEVLKIPGTMSATLAFSPDGRLLAAGNGSAEGMIASFGGGTVELWDSLTGAKVRQLPGHTSALNCLAFSPDGTRLASGSADYTVLIWATARPAAKPAPAATVQQLQAWWADLADDAAAAHKASAQLVARPAQAVALLAKHLKPAPAVDGKQIAGLIKDLDDRRFAVRDRASAALERWGDLAEAALRQALAKPLSLEYRRRLEQLLGKQEGVPAPVQLRKLRAVAVLEWDGGAEARKLLAALAGGAPRPGSRAKRKGRCDGWTAGSQRQNSSWELGRAEFTWSGSQSCGPRTAGRRCQAPHLDV